MATKKLYTDISPEAYKKFLVIKGAHGVESNGEAFETMIEEQYPKAVKSLKLKGK